MKKVVTVAAIAGAFAMIMAVASFKVSAQSMSNGAGAKAQGITIDNFSFTPTELVVPLGATVTWTNHDDIPHTVVQTEQQFKSKALDTDQSYSFTFSKPGTYQYFCSIHPKMVGKIVVKEGM